MIRKSFFRLLCKLMFINCVLLFNELNAQTPVVGGCACTTPCSGDYAFTNTFSNCSVVIRWQLDNLANPPPTFCSTVNNITVPANTTICLIPCANFGACPPSTSRFNVTITVSDIGGTAINNNNTVDHAVNFSTTTGSNSFTPTLSTCTSSTYELQIINGCLAQIGP
jgi:hypothetical protein